MTPSTATVTLLYQPCSTFLTSVMKGAIQKQTYKSIDELCHNANLLISKQSFPFKGDDVLLMGKLLVCLNSTGCLYTGATYPKGVSEAITAYNKWVDAHPVIPFTPVNPDFPMHLNPELYYSCKDYVAYMVKASKTKDTKKLATDMKAYYASPRFATDYNKYLNMSSDAGDYQLLLMGKAAVCLGNLGYDVTPPATGPTAGYMNATFFSNIVTAYNEWVSINMPTDMNFVDPNTKWSTIFYSVILVLVLILLFVLLSRKGN